GGGSRGTRVASRDGTDGRGTGRRRSRHEDGPLRLLRLCRRESQRPQKPLLRSRSPGRQEREQAEGQRHGNGGGHGRGATDGRGISGAAETWSVRYEDVELDSNSRRDQEP